MLYSCLPSSRWFAAGSHAPVWEPIPLFIVSARYAFPRWSMGTRCTRCKISSPGLACFAVMDVYHVAAGARPRTQRRMPSCSPDDISVVFRLLISLLFLLLFLFIIFLFIFLFVIPVLFFFMRAAEKETTEAVEEHG